MNSVVTARYREERKDVRVDRLGKRIYFCNQKFFFPTITKVSTVSEACKFSLIATCI